MRPECFHAINTFFMACFMSLWPSHKGLPRWSYVIILVSLLPLELLLLVTFAATVIRMPFYGYRIILVNCSCLCWDAFFTPIIIAETSRLCSEINAFVVTEAVLLVVLLFCIRSSFNACYIYGSSSKHCWVLQLICDHYSFPYHLVGMLMSTPFSLWFLFSLPFPPQPSRPPRPPLSPLPSELTFSICPYLPGDGRVAVKRRDITIDKYVEAVSKIALWLYKHIITSVFKSMFLILMLSKSCLTLSSSYRGTLKFSSTLNFYFVLVTYFSKEKVFSPYKITYLGFS